MHHKKVHPMIFCPRHLSFGQTNVSAVLISLRFARPSLKSGTVFAILGIHQQKVMSKRKPAPFEQQRVSVPIEE